MSELFLAERERIAYEQALQAERERMEILLYLEFS